MTRPAADSLRPLDDGHAFSRADAAHLLRRAGFGGTPDEIDAAVRRGRGEAIAFALADRSTPQHDRIRELATPIVRGGDVDQLSAWWLRVMVDSPAPFRERLALVWHDHFAVSAAKVTQAGWLYRQYGLFRELGAGDLRTLTKTVVRDPAMLRFLDGDTNEKDSPNENLARELFELFLLGIGHYTERDIKEAARALTGLKQKHGQPHFTRRLHDAGEKTIFGQRGAFGADELIDLCFRREPTATFLAGRLLRAFVRPDPSPELEAAAGQLLREVEFDVTAFMSRVFASRLFWAKETRRALIKSPVEYSVGVVRQLEGRIDTNELGDSVRAMGQRLFYPPGVQGWTGGRDWLNSVRWIARERFAARFARSWRDDPPGYPLATWSKRAKRPPLLESLLDRLVDGEISDEVRTALEASDCDTEGLIAIVLTLPEYHVT